MIPLCTRSHYSFMQGTAPVKNLCAQARQYGYPRLALTDIDNLCGMWTFINQCRAFGLQPIIGAQVTDPENAGHTTVCLVKDPKGYSNLTRLITQRHRDDGFALKTTLPRFAKGLAVLTDDPELLVFWHENNIDLAAHAARHPISSHHPLSRTAAARDIPIVTTPDSFMLSPEEIRIHRLLRAIDNNTSLSRLSAKDCAPSTAFLAPPAMVKKKFHMQPEVLKNSQILSEKLTFQAPDFGIVMPPLKTPLQTSACQHLYEKAMQGAKKRYGASLPGKVIQRIDYELAIIEQKNFCQYFLVVANIVEKASRICGRGSGAASIVAYCLGITNVCPIKHHLYFERFLNPDRTDPPDIDIDFAWDERDDILNQVLTEFDGHSAMVSSHILFQPRMAVRETAKVFGLPDAEISKVSKRLPWFWKQHQTDESLLHSIQQEPAFRFMDFPDPWPKIMACAKAVIGTPRYLSVHPGGVVITPAPIDTYVPVQTAPKGVPLIQWEKDAAEEAGLVKIDLLGNRSLGVIRDCIASIRTSKGKFDDFGTMDPEDDLDTQHNVAQGNTMGCFYIESPATRLLQKKSRAGDFDHVVIHSSIIRPAANEFIQEYIKRLHTGIWKPIHPLLEDVLNETYGIMVYQEDVSKVAVKMAGFTHAQGDGLRKIMSKKDKYQKLKDYYTLFEKGALKKGVTLRDIKRVWKMIESFSGYSFCKPHSASYARVSFQAAYLKTHYPAQFMAAVISNQGGFYSTFAYVSEARRMNVEILPPDIHQSNILWQGCQLQIRVGLSAIRDLSITTMTAIIKERKKALFSSLEDFFARVRPKENEIRPLVYSGSLDVLDRFNNRAMMLWLFAVWQQRNVYLGGHMLLFHPKNPKSRTSDAFPHEIPSSLIPQLPKDDPFKKLRNEFSVLGFLCSMHPMVLYSNVIKRHNSIKAENLSLHVDRKVVFAGWLITGKVVRTKHGDPMKFLTFEDETGIVETVFFPKPYARFCHMLETGRPYLLYGRVDSNWGAITLVVEQTAVIHFQTKEAVSLQELKKPSGKLSRLGHAGVIV